MSQCQSCGNETNNHTKDCATLKTSAQVLLEIIQSKMVDDAFMVHSSRLLPTRSYLTEKMDYSIFTRKNQ